MEGYSQYSSYSYNLTDLTLLHTSQSLVVVVVVVVVEEYLYGAAETESHYSPGFSASTAVVVGSPTVTAAGLVITIYMQSPIAHSAVSISSALAAPGIMVSFLKLTSRGQCLGQIVRSGQVVA